jgi:hypothetical protein
LVLNVDAQIVEAQHRHLQERIQIALLEWTALHFPLHFLVLQCEPLECNDVQNAYSGVVVNVESEVHVNLMRQWQYNDALDHVIQILLQIVQQDLWIVVHRFSDDWNHISERRKEKLTVSRGRFRILRNKTYRKFSRLQRMCEDMFDVFWN